MNYVRGPALTTGILKAGRAEGGGAGPALAGGGGSAVHAPGALPALHPAIATRSPDLGE